MNTLQQHREHSTLSVKMKFEEGIMTRKEWIELKHRQGTHYVTKDQRPRIMFNRIKYNRMNGREQEQYEKKCAEMVDSYSLRTHGTDVSTDITLAEYNYFSSL